jgi:hypothetical protein
MIKAGEIVAIEHGAYADRYLIGCFTALRDIPLSEWNEVRARHIDPRQSGFGEDVNHTAMLREMEAAGMIEPTAGVHYIHGDDVLTEDGE